MQQTVASAYQISPGNLLHYDNPIIKLRVEAMANLDNPESDLVSSVCEACRIDAPKVTAAQIELLHPQIPDWEMIQVNGIDQLQRQFTFGNFLDALQFTNKVGELAESEGHHPALLTEWGKVQVSWWSHKIKGLHRNDFIMAAKTDALFP